MFWSKQVKKRDGIRVLGGMGMYLAGWGCIWRDRDENMGFGDKLGIKLAGWVFFSLFILYTFEA